MISYTDKKVRPDITAPGLNRNHCLCVVFGWATRSATQHGDWTMSCPVMHGRHWIYYSTIELIINYEKPSVTA